jgi:hypothetical protein
MTSPASSMIRRQRSARDPAQPPVRVLVFGKPATLVYLHERVLLPLVEKAGVSWHGWHAFLECAISSWLAAGTDPQDGVLGRA